MYMRVMMVTSVAFIIPPPGVIDILIEVLSMTLA
jgi:hypothetical protein